MKEALTELIGDFYERVLPELEERQIALPELERNATVLIGMRRTGKTFRIYQRVRELIAAGVRRDRVLYLNFDDDRLYGIGIEDLKYIPEIFYKLNPDNRLEKVYFFFDEIQDVPNWELFVRRLIDSGNIQVYLTGSSAKLLSGEVATTMRGRSVEVEVFPLSFAEFMKFHRIFVEIPQTFGAATKDRLRNALDKYFMIGGFPDVQRCDNALRVMLLQNYAEEVVFHDIVERFRVSNVPALKFVLKRVLHTPGGKISALTMYKDLKSAHIKCDRESISQYLDYFCQAYLLYRVPLRTDSFAQSRVNPSKFYPVDVALVRAMNTKQSLDKGYLLESLVFLHLRRRGLIIEYGITKSGYEIDFLVRERNSAEFDAIQVCYDLSDKQTEIRECRALHEVRKHLPVKRCVIVTWDDAFSQKDGIDCVPAWQYLLDR